jgi:hypothetical protein
MLQPIKFIGAGSDAVGGIVSWIVMVCDTEALFPQSSVKLHVRVIVPGHDPITGESVPATEPLGIQSSVKDKLIIGGTSAVHATVISAGGGVNTGPVFPVMVYV